MSKVEVLYLFVSLTALCTCIRADTDGCVWSTGGNTGQLCIEEKILSRHRRQEGGAVGGAVEGGAAEGGGVIEGGGAIEGGGGAIEGEGGVADRVEVEGGAVIRPDLAVEVFIVLDYSAYSLWLNTTRNLTALGIWSFKTNVTERLIEWYTLHMQGVNERYRSTEGSFKLTIELTGMYIATTGGIQPWIRLRSNTSQSNMNRPTNQAVNWTESVEAFIEWTAARYSGEPADHYIWITGYNKSYVYSESICSNTSISILPHDLDFRIQTRIAHQIGRSLGLTLDDNVDCIDDGSVMSPILYPTGRTGANPWRFSACSQQEIVNVLKNNHM